MAEGKQDTVAKIDEFLKTKGKTSKTSYRSFVPLRKLMNCQWGEEKEMREVALDCMREMMEHDDELANTFMKKLFMESGLIGQSVIRQYMVNNAIDLLPIRG
jgi:hypothetical protein